MTYHRPVLLEECIEGLNINPDGVYVDLTFGGGGHSAAILEKLEKGKLIAFDQDADSQQNLLEDDRLILIQQNFRFLEKFLKLYKFPQVHGILGDLGVSSHQIDTPERGFSIRYDGPLDMRMDKKSILTARDVLNEYAEKDLAQLLFDYGDLRQSRKLAAIIVQHRQQQKLQTTNDLVNLISPHIGGMKNKVLAKLFQAIRIEVNQEIEALKDVLIQSSNVLKPNGRLVVISYHSHEDRLVKNFFKTGTFNGVPEKDLYGNFEKPLQAINKKVIIPSDTEIKQNPRARSAKLRIAKK